MKYLVVIIMFLVCFVSCKKDTKVEPIDKGPSERYKILTSHYWRFTGKWNDTTDYAKDHPDLVPLPTSKYIIMLNL